MTTTHEPASTNHEDTSRIANDIFSGIPAKVLARVLGCSHRTIEVRRTRGMGWRAEDIIIASAHLAEVRARALATLARIEQCPPSS